MKKKLKIIVLLLLFGTVFMLQSCEKELYEDHIEQSRLKTLSLKDLPMLQNAINSKRAAMRNTANKEAIDYLSLINTDEVKLFENADGSKDYTFSLRLKEQEKLTNLIIKQYGEQYYYKIIEYTSPNFEQWIEEVKNNGFSMQPMSVELFDLDKVGGDCIAYAIICASLEHSSALGNLDQCSLPTSMWGAVTYQVPCVEDSGGSGGGGSNNSTDDGGQNGESGNYTSGGSGGGGGSSYNTVPTPCTRCDFDRMEPCQELNRLSQNASFQIANSNLEDQVYADQEYGYSVSIDNNSNYTTPVPCGNSVTNPVMAAIPVGGKRVGGMHSHFPYQDASVENYDLMFSDVDISWLYNVAIRFDSEGQPKDYSYFFITMTNSAGTFALKIKDFYKFASFINNDDLWEVEDGVDGLPSLFNNYKLLGSNGTFNQFANAFLTVLKNNDAGIGLYQKDSNNNWDELTLDPLAAQDPYKEPKKKPCNN